MTGKEKEYEATEEAYQEIYSSPSNQHLYGIRHCREFAKFAREIDTGEVRIFGDSCRDRWCPMCAAEKQNFASDQTNAYIATLKAPRFLTLTLKHQESPLRQQLDFLQESFRKLRSRAYWKKNVTGGIWFMQITLSKTDGLWHPHIHILLDGYYMEQGRLSKLWELVTYGSIILDIRRVHNRESTATYIARYAARPALLREFGLEKRCELIMAFQGKRLCGTFGSAKCVVLTPPKVTDDCEWQNIANYDQLVRDAQTNPDAQLILDAYAAEQPIDEAIYERYTGMPGGRVHIPMPDHKPAQYLLDFYNTS
jgi:hypothetical protein